MVLFGFGLTIEEQPGLTEMVEKTTTSGSDFFRINSFGVSGISSFRRFCLSRIPIGQ